MQTEYSIKGRLYIKGWYKVSSRLYGAHASVFQPCVFIIAVTCAAYVIYIHIQDNKYVCGLKHIQDSHSARDLSGCIDFARWGSDSIKNCLIGLNFKITHLNF